LNRTELGETLWPLSIARKALNDFPRDGRN
jgi:hypothetical protein